MTQTAAAIAETQRIEPASTRPRHVSALRVDSQEASASGFCGVSSWSHVAPHETHRLIQATELGLGHTPSRLQPIHRQLRPGVW